MAKPTDESDLSAAEYERLADLAEAGFDPATFRVRPGRPSIGDGTAGQHSPRMATRVSPVVRAAFIARARAEGKTPSQAMRELVEAWAGQRSRSGGAAIRGE
jgi:hypothetical protein